MPHLTFDVRANGSTRVVIAVAGEVDLATAPQLLELLNAHADRDVIVDLSGVGFLDSSGINALIQGYNTLRDQNHTMRTIGEQDHVLRLLELTGLTDILHAEDRAPES